MEAGGAANDNSKWLVNAGSKGPTMGHNSNEGRRTKTSCQSCEGPNHIVPRFKRLKVTVGRIPKNRHKPLKESSEEPNGFVKIIIIIIIIINNPRKGQTALCQDLPMKESWITTKVGDR